ncbi:MAG: hypothetical protein IIC70_02135 [Acidobacteria bacterium]|nr:hypothetical protein [Acidobacteriota bacterium]
MKARYPHVMAVDLAGTVTYLKDHAVEHGFHVHDERHFVETYTLRQAWEVDVHPAEACEGPLDLHVAIDLDPRVVLDLEDALADTTDIPEDPTGKFIVPFMFNWSLPPLGARPDLIVLATELAAKGGTDLPIEVSAVDTYGALSDGEEHQLSLVAKVEISLIDLMYRQDTLCEVLDRVHDVSMYLVEESRSWEVQE